MRDQQGGAKSNFKETTKRWTPGWYSIRVRQSARDTKEYRSSAEIRVSCPLQKYTIQIPLNTIEYHSVPLDHSMVFQHDSVVFPMVICNTIQYHWTIQWYFSRLNGTLGYSMVFLLDSMVLWMVIRNTIQDHWTIQWYILFSVVFSMVFQNTIEYHWTTQW